MTITITLTLEDNEAAALKRFAEKITHVQAMDVLYAHLPKEVRARQAAEILSGFAQLERALFDARVSGWPWIEGG